MSFNKVILMGNLTADPETRTTPNGQTVTSFTIAVNRSVRTSDGNRREETSFINCTSWGAQGETIAKYVQKGRQLLVSGRLQQRSWEDKETGKKRSAIDVVVEEFSFVSDGNRGGSSSGGASSNAGGGAVSTADIDEPIDLTDIPF